MILWHYETVRRELQNATHIAIVQGLERAHILFSRKNFAALLKFSWISEWLIEIDTTSRILISNVHRLSMCFQINCHLSVLDACSFIYEWLQQMGYFNAWLVAFMWLMYAVLFVMLDGLQANVMSIFIGNSIAGGVF